MRVKLKYWIFAEKDLDAMLRAWATDHRHDDVTEPAARRRFEQVADFLYSRHVRQKALKEIDLVPDETARDGVWTIF